MPTWSIIHSRHWKMQIPYLARHWRVLTFDGRGNGRSDRPTDPEAYREEEFAADALAVMDATATERAVLVSLSRGAERSLLLAADHPERVEKMAFIAPAAAGAPGRASFEGDTGVPGAARHVRRLGEVQPPLLGRALRGFPRVLLLAMPDRAALDEAARGHGRVGARDGRPTLVATQLAPRLQDEADVRALLSRIDCPILVIHGSDDHVRPWESGARLAELANGRARRPRGVGPPPARPRPGHGQPAAPRLHRSMDGIAMTAMRTGAGRRPTDAGRAVLPSERGFVERARRRPHRLRCLRLGRRRWSCFHRTRSSTRASGRARSRT